MVDVVRKEAGELMSVWVGEGKGREGPGSGEHGVQRATLIQGHSKIRTD